MINLEQKEGFLNRHKNSLPKEKCIIRVVVLDVEGEHIYLCEWKPFDESQYTETNILAKGYLGTAKVIEGKQTGISFHAWEQNNNEFIWYAIV